MSSHSVSAVPSKHRFKTVLPIVAAVIALIIGAVSVYAVLVGPSKQPYRDALTQYQNFYNANVAFTNSGAAINSGAATDEQFSENIETLRAAKNSIEIENEALSKQAVLKDGEGKALYDAFNTQLAKYLAYNEEVIDSIETLRPILFVCNAQMNNVSQDAAGAAALRSCADDLDDAKDVPNEDYERMAVSFSSYYNEAADAVEAIAALKDPEGADNDTYDSLVSQQEAAIEGLSTASATLSSELQKGRDSVDITNSAMKLDDYLSAQARIF